MTADNPGGPQSADQSTNKGPGADRPAPADTTKPSGTPTQPGTPEGDKRATPTGLRDHIERTRADLGETVEALAAKAGLKAGAKDAAGRALRNINAQARHTFASARLKAVPAAQQALLKAREFATKARNIATSGDASVQARRGTAVAAATAAVLAVVWVRRRRQARRLTRWQRTMRTARQTGAQVRDKLRRTE